MPPEGIYDREVSSELDKTPPANFGVQGTAAPPTAARVLAILAIIVSGLCGGLIGFGVADLQCTGSCDAWTGLGALIGAIAAAGGVAIVAVLVLRAMGEWQATGHEPPRRPL